MPDTTSVSPEVVSEGLSDVLTNIGEGVTAMLQWVASVANAVVSNPILLIGCILGIGMMAIGIFKALFH